MNLKLIFTFLISVNAMTFGIFDEMYQKDNIVIKFKKSYEKSVFPIWSFLDTRDLQLKPLFKYYSQDSKLGLYYSLSFNDKLSTNKLDQILKTLKLQSNVDTVHLAPRVGTHSFDDKNLFRDLPKINNNLLYDRRLHSHGVFNHEVDPVAPHIFKVPNFEKYQTYLKPAPNGVDAYYAWTFDGGKGENIKYIDIEANLDTNHIEFSPMFHYIEHPYLELDHGKKSHGTKVRGILQAKDDGQGIVGITPSSSFGFISRASFLSGSVTYYESVVRGIEKATMLLSKGDVLILELQTQGPNYTGHHSGKGYVPIEYIPEIFDVIKLATQRGIICVAAAGNGSENLDDPIYKGAFDVNRKDSGCIIVGASNSDRSRALFSNYGSRIDAFAYGEKVLTSGPGSFFNSRHNSSSYTYFTGTSAATPIVAGAIGSLSSIAIEQGQLLSSKDIRSALRQSGTPQTLEGESKKVANIGRLPDLKSLIQFFKLKQKSNL